MSITILIDLFIAAYLVVAALDGAVLVALLLVVEAFAVACGSVVSTSLRQATVPDELRGRVGNAYRSCLWGVTPLGALLGGALASVAGTRVVFAVAGGLQLVLTAALAPRLARRLGESSPATAARE